MNSIHAALEIGTSRTVLAVGESDGNGRVKITCHAEIPSTGVRKSQILDIAQATESIRSVLHEAQLHQDEAGAKVTLGNAFLVISGQHLKADPFTGTVQVESGKVSQRDLDEVQQAARAMTLPGDRELLEAAEQDYVLDNLGGITSPRGMSGRILKLNTLQVHADRNRLQDARAAADAAHLELRDPLFAASAAGEAVLDERERRNGTLVLDLGGGSTGYAAYTDGYLAAAGVIGVGGDHITSDIAQAFQTTNAQAESIKLRAASALLGGNETDRIRVEPDGNSLMDNRTISRHALNTVVNARLLELSSVLSETLEGLDLLHRLHAGVVLTGGGARLPNLDGLLKQTLGMNVRLGRPINVDGLEKEEFPPAYAAIAGALIYAHRNYEEKSILDGLFGRFFR